MNRLKAFKSEYLVLLGLILFGTFFRISTSELWPISISKTWYSPDQFEYSMLQKPLLSLFLSIFHLLPLDDVSHIILVKAVFACIGAIGLWSLSKFLNLIASDADHKAPNSVLILVCILLISPTTLTNFFNVRSDQLASSLFSIFLLLSYQKKLIPSLICLALIPLAGVKEVFFLIPGLFVFCYHFKHLINLKILFFLGYGALTIIVWLIALNISAIYYFLETFEQISFSSKLMSYSFEVESLSLILTLLSCFYILIGQKKGFRLYVLQSAFFIAVLAALPQTYSFLIGSVLPFIFIPLIVIILKTSLKRKFAAITIVLCQYSFVFYTQLNNNAFVYTSLLDQIRYISSVSKIVERNSLTYLDGVGILPRQKHYPCFASPYDQVANSSCLERILGQQLDSFIISSRLMYVGEQIFQVAEKDYEEILPNFWVHKNKLNDDILGSKNKNADLSPAFLLF